MNVCLGSGAGSQQEKREEALLYGHLTAYPVAALRDNAKMNSLRYVYTAVKQLRLALVR